jgi:hypothetical protein
MHGLCGCFLKWKNKNGIKELPKPLPVLPLQVKDLIFDGFLQANLSLYSEQLEKRCGSAFLSTSDAPTPVAPHLRKLRQRSSGHVTTSATMDAPH